MGGRVTGPVPSADHKATLLPALLVIVGRWIFWPVRPQYGTDAVRAVPGAGAKVGGGTAVTMDVEHYATRDRNPIIPLVLVVVLIILALLLRRRAGPAGDHGTVLGRYAGVRFASIWSKSPNPLKVPPPDHCHITALLSELVTPP